MDDTATTVRQCAALPVRRVNGAPQVLLVSSRETRRWVIPKGWPMAGLSHAQSAAREAFEEAGVAGRIEERPLGTFAYDKRKKSGALLPCRVEVFRLEVSTVHADWPEAAERTRKWVAPAEAANLVAEPELAALLRGIS